MRKSDIHIIFLLPFLFFSCTTYQYLSLGSQLPKTEDGIFFYENDSIRVDYDFLDDGNLQMTLSNKLDKLMYVDWDKSAIIINDVSHSLNTGTQSIKGSVTTYRLTDDFATGDIEGQVSTRSSVRQYIPPKSKIVRDFDQLSFSYDQLTNSKDAQKIKLPAGTADRFVFDEIDSLNRTRSYIYYALHESDRAVELSHNFWVREIVETGFDDIPLDYQLKHSSMSTAGTALATAGVLGIVVLVVNYENN